MRRARSCRFSAPLLVLLAACAGGGPDDKADADTAAPAVEPLALPDDPGADGAPVGVASVDVGGRPVAIWYPAAESARGQPTETVDVKGLLSAEVQSALADVPVPSLPTRAVRDAPVRNTGEPLPVLLFSHGFGGMRYQSVDLTVHLASRGYVVVAPDHAGRSLGDLLPCIFSPPLPGCALGGADPGPDDMRALLDWLEQDGGPVAGRVDLDRLGLFGHSAGGGTTSTLGEADPRFGALLVMAAPPAVQRDVPVLLMDGTCDTIIPEEDVLPSFGGLQDGVRVALVGAGHLAFSDLCALDMGTIADEHLAPRDDVNGAILGSLVQLATDGCPGGAPPDRPECADGFLPLEVSAPVVRAAATAFFDAALAGSGPGVLDDYGAGVEVQRGP